MNWHELDQLGDHLRSLGHERRELVEAIRREVRDGRSREPEFLLQRLSEVSREAIDLIQQQQEILEQALQVRPS